ncbi:non-ribosomal peptide synthetase, partial [Dyella flagellata]
MSEYLIRLRHAWREQLGGQPACLNLPFDHPRTAVKGDRVGRIQVTYPAGLVRDIQQVTALHQLTVFTLLETSLAMVFGQLARSRDVVVGTTVESHQQPGAETKTDPSFNIIALPHRVRGAVSVLSHWQEGVEALQWGQQHGELPFADIVAAVNPPRSASHDPIFQVFCRLQQQTVEHPDSLKANGLCADVAVVFQQDADSLQAEVEYNAELFEAATVEAVLSLYQLFLLQALRAPETCLEATWRASVASIETSGNHAVLGRLLHRPVAGTGAWYPLSPAQEAVWIGKQAAPRGSSYQAIAVMRCSPCVDHDRLEAAARGLITQHQSCWLEWTDLGLQHQSFTPMTRVVHKLSQEAIGEDAQRQRVLQWHRELMENPADTAGTIAIFHWPDSILVALRMHHIVYDGWSVVRYYERLAKNYALLEKDPSHGFEMDRFYLDTLKSEQAYLDSPRYAEDGLFWQASCAKLPAVPLVGVLADRPHATDVAHQVTSVFRTLPPLLQEVLHQVADSASVSPAECLTALTALYLARVSGEGELALGVAFLNRTREALDIPGQFAKALPLGLSLDLAQDTLSDGIAKVCEAFRQVLQHGRYPFGEMVRKHSLDARHAEISVNTLFLKRGVELAGEPAHVQWISGPEGGLSFLYTQFGRQASVDLELRFNRAVFDEATVERHADRLLQFLAHACDDIKALLKDVQLLLEEERCWLLDAWNATEQPYPQEKCVHQLFEEQVARDPEAVALIVGEEQFSYAQLNRRANAIAYRLIQEGVKPDERVAICAQRSIGMVAGWLGILKAGGAYVPLDPAHPGERLRQILTDAEPKLLLLDNAGKDAIGEGAFVTCQNLALDDAAGWPAQMSGNPRVRALNSRHLAYVIYTSGSTGNPKGVMVEHRSLVNLVSWHVEQFGLGLGHRSTATAGVGFDASTWEVWPALSAGTTLLLPPSTMTRDPESLLQWWREQTIDHAFLVTPLAQLAMEAALPSGLQQLLVGGDRLNALSRSLPPHVRVINNYGPTETTVVATSGRVGRDDAVPSIGRPIANTRIYLLDARQQPVPLGAVGELYIGGAGVARGYWNREELTADRFLRDPFSDKADARMYRTGDLAKYLPDGNLIYLGRNDSQVKIRGFRIEPGEIEARLLELDDVREAAVIAREGRANEQRLVAYVVLHERAVVDDPISGLRAHLDQRLPDYMLPSAFVPMEALPLTPNGKLDRQALPPPDEEAYARERYESPQGDMEQTLAQIWQELLGVEQVGRYDNFFTLGGHSLLAVQHMERLRRLGLAFDVRALFATPRLCDLAAALGHSREVVVPPNRILFDSAAITPAMLPLIDLTQSDIDRIVAQVPGGIGNIQDIYALSPLQDGILFHHLLSKEGDPYLLVGQLAFADRPSLDRFVEALQQVVERHDILRTAIVWKGLSMPAQVVWRHAGVPVTSWELDPSAGSIAEQLRSCVDPRHHSIDLSQAPLLLHDIAQDSSDGRWHMVQRLHHLAGDHSTLEILYREVHAILCGQGAQLAPAQPFRNLIAQARLGVSEAEHEQYFQAQLRDIEEPCLPFGLSEVHRGGEQVEERHERLPARLNERLRAQARRRGVSLASLCHLAWGQVVARSSGQDTAVFGTVLFGRMHAGSGADQAMGLFINTLPLRLDLDETTVEASVQIAHRRLAELLQHEHASLSLAQRCSSVAAPAPLFSALLNYRHNRDFDETSIVDQSLGMEWLGNEERTNYPLILAVEDYGDALGVTAQVISPWRPEQICGYMRCALESLVEALEHAPDTPVRALNIVPKAERELLLGTRNAKAPSCLADHCIHQLFEAQAQRSPDALAIIYGEERLSYAEL